MACSDVRCHFALNDGILGLRDTLLSLIVVFLYLFDEIENDLLISMGALCLVLAVDERLLEDLVLKLARKFVFKVLLCLFTVLHFLVLKPLILLQRDQLTCNLVLHELWIIRF